MNEVQGVGATVRAWRKEAGLSREQLAEKAKIAISQIRRIEETITLVPRLKTLLAIARACGKTEEDARALHGIAKQLRPEAPSQFSKEDIEKAALMVEQLGGYVAPQELLTLLALVRTRRLNPSLSSSAGAATPP